MLVSCPLLPKRPHPLLDDTINQVYLGMLKAKSGTLRAGEKSLGRTVGLHNAMKKLLAIKTLSRLKSWAAHINLERLLKHSKACQHLSNRELVFETEK